jgi:hypothetical protein
MPDFVAGEIVTANKMNQIPKGVLGYAIRTENIPNLTGGPIDLPDLSVQVSVPAGRVIRVVGYVHAWSGAATTGEEANFSVREGDTTLGNKRVIRTNPNRAEGGAVQALIFPSAGPHTYKLTFEQVIGSTGWILVASASTPAYILVEDIGAVPNA